ncbi:MAG: right-handed parallel beta-helix repeat-containing protein [Acidimicrobiales bacterium]
MALGMIAAVLVAAAVMAIPAETAPTASQVSCDGSGDAAAISAAAGPVVEVQGTCLLEAPVRLEGGVTYIGHGATLRATVPMPALMASVGWLDDHLWTQYPHRVIGFELDGAGLAERGLVVRAWGSLIEALYVYDVTGDGIVVSNESQNGTLLANTQVNGTIRSVRVDGVGGNGVRVVDGGNSVTDWTLQDSWIGNPGGDGVFLENAAGWQVRNVHIYGVGGDAIDARRCYGTGIEGNYIEDFAAGQWGISCTVQGDSSTVIAGNRVQGTTGTWIGLYGTYGVGLVAVTGNVLRGVGAGGTGIVTAKNTASRLTVVKSGNLIDSGV